MDYISGDLIRDSLLIIKSQTFVHAATIKLEGDNSQNNQEEILI